MPDLDRLLALGFDLGQATDEQIAVLVSLSEEEIGLLVDVKRRLDEAGNDIELHSIEGGALLW